MKILAIFCFAAIAATGFAGNLLRASAAPEKAAINFLADDVSGKELFKNNCAKCHGAEGAGGKAPNLTTEKKQAKWKDSDEKLIAKINNGGFGMPKFADKLKPEEIKAIADYVRTFKPQEAAPVK